MTPDFTQSWPINLRRWPEQRSVTWELVVAGNVAKSFTTEREDFTPEEALRELLAL